MKLCKDCKWCDLSSDERFAICDFIKVCKKSNIDGKLYPVKQHWKYCWIIRENSIADYILCYIFGTCGPQGRYFQPKDTQQVKGGKQK